MPRTVRGWIPAAVRNYRLDGLRVSKSGCRPESEIPLPAIKFLWTGAVLICNRDSRQLKHLRPPLCARRRSTTCPAPGRFSPGRWRHPAAFGAAAALVRSQEVDRLSSARSVLARALEAPGGVGGRGRPCALEGGRPPVQRQVGSHPGPEGIRRRWVRGRPCALEGGRPPVQRQVGSHPGVGGIRRRWVRGRPCSLEGGRPPVQRQVGSHPGAGGIRRCWVRGRPCSLEGGRPPVQRQVGSGPGRWRHPAALGPRPPLCARRRSRACPAPGRFSPGRWRYPAALGPRPPLYARRRSTTCPAPGRFWPGRWKHPSNLQSRLARCTSAMPIEPPSR